MAIPILVGLLLALPSLASQTYTVRRGETVYLIAQKFHTTLGALQQANHLESVDRIKTGQVLVIPSKDTGAPTTGVTYGVAKEDNLVVESGESVITALSKGARFVVLAREGDKFKVKLLDGKIGWVLADEVTLEETRKPLPVSDSWSLKSDIVRRAYAYRGARYRRGGMSSGGFDCSGFVKFLYSVKGIKLPHSSRSLFHCGTPISKSALQPGDLVFFSGTYRRGISHVGIFVGSGKFIHASTHRGGVRVDYLNAPYYASRYSGARRIR